MSPSEKMERLAPVHPGEILLEEFLQPMGLSQNRLEMHMGILARRINAIILWKRAITAHTALRLARALNTTPQFRLNLQTIYDLEVVKDQLGTRLEEEVRPIPV